MGLDAVEIILRAEELFAIDIPDRDASTVKTVGDFYNLICGKSGVPPLESPETSEKLPTITERERIFLFLARLKPLPAPNSVLPWSPQSVWDCTVAIFVDQMGLKPEEIIHGAQIAADLGVD
ncbi:MAG TPA: hypothetical protein VGL22_21270 [Terracidiphilus sp.]|jgi:hypothetical protein